MTTRPNVYASFHVPGRDGCLLRNDQGQELWVTAEAAGDVAIMLSNFCTDADLCEFVAEEWTGRGFELTEYGPDPGEDELEFEEDHDES